METFLHLLLFLLPFILPASGCIKIGSGGCLPNRPTFGGRLVFSGDIGMNFGNLPTLNGNRVFIFQTPPHMKRTFLRPSAGSGQIWIGRTSCAGTAPGYCPSDEARPCLDSGGPECPPPCSLALNVDEKNVLTFTWERPTCVPETEDLTYKYTFWMDGNTETGTTTDLRKIFDSFHPDSKYFFEVNVTTSTGFYSNYTSKAPPSYTNTMPLTFDVTTTGVTVRWPEWDKDTDKGRGPIAEYIIQYRQQGESMFKRFSKGLNRVHQFENLISGATYEFQVILVKSDPSEEGNPSRIQEAVIDCPAPTGINTLSLESENSVEIYAEWSVSPGLSEFCSLDQTLTVRLITLDQCNPSSSSTPDEYTVDGYDRSTTIRDMISPNSEYEVTITVNGGIMAMKRIVTAETVPSMPPVLLAPVIAPVTQIRFNWDLPPCEHRNGMITNYVCQYLVWLEGSTEPTVAESMTTNTAKSFEYFPDSRYTFSVRALTAKGEGPTAVIDPPSYKDESPLTFDATSTSITVRWPAWNEDVDFGDGPVVAYILQYRDQNMRVFTENKGLGLTHSVISVEGSIYEFQIKLVKDNPTVEGRLSTIQEYLSCEGVQFTQLTSESVHAGNVLLNAIWESPANPSTACEIDSQTLTIQLLSLDGCPNTMGDVEMTDLNGNDRSHNITGMKPNSKYDVTLQMQTRGGLFSFSKTIDTVETEPTGTPLRVREKRRVGMIFFMWDQPRCGSKNGALTYHYYMVVNDKVIEGDTPRKVTPLSGLNEGDRYSFKVLAWTSVGKGSYTRNHESTYRLP